jgi:hypothetical protein
MNYESADVILRALVERIANVPWGASRLPAQGRVFSGALPSDMPADIPILPDSHLLGSVVQPYIEGTYMLEMPLPEPAEASVMLYFDVPGDPQSVVSRYDAILREQGWTIPPDPMESFRAKMGGGFEHPDPPRAPHRTYCAGPKGPAVSVIAYPGIAGVSDVRIWVRPTDRVLCSPPPPQPDRLVEMRRSLRMTPRLELPPDASIVWNQGQGGDRRWMEMCDCETEMSAEQLAAHVAPQMQSLGWTQLDEGVNGALAWSRWTRTDDGKWNATLTVVEEPEPGRRSLRMRVWEVDGASRSG